MDLLEKGEHLVLNNLQHLLTGLSQTITWTYVEHPNETLIEGISFSSKEVKNNYLFVCITGHRHDGHNFIDEAIANGAIAIIAERPIDAPVSVIYCRDTKIALAELAAMFYDDPSKRLRLHGVTGTNGKTTTTSLAFQLFTSLGMKAGSIGTLGIHYAGQTFTTPNTTPDPLTVNRHLDEMVKAGITDCVMEVSSQAIAESRITGLSFQSASFLNLTHDHLDYHGSMDSYAETKARLFKQVTANGHVFLNRDDPFHERMGARAPRRVKRSYYSRRDTSVDLFGQLERDRLLLQTKGRSLAVKPPFTETYNLDNMLCALGIVLSTGASLEDTVPRLASLRLPSGRLERIEGIASLAYVDYGHTPDAIQEVVTALTERHARVLVLLSAAGERDRSKRSEMTKIVSQSGADYVLSVHDPRREAPQQILDDLASGRTARPPLSVHPIRHDAIRAFAERLPDYDCGVIFGKGHDRIERVDGELIPCDEPALVHRFYPHEREPGDASRTER
ncbi:UDP-N-acetylmuramoyl-L-alanyl-D-glutamate--2,6-diaminopimelate ligase [Exiguobacterium aurantiacum]|uniref:UDP-N-acetylmuramoyl-L-alanyl-D-glutamate--2, 6-diaminopimelate ligase n=1 Tax=Exiguobacterium aurantiacum TaxID=33987 RepID=UPI0009DED579|nr:UDP-N-acetylmuramoyl-L-alanyl-D-glutamate--2,6-diaminopimelate ligase [Exiguobacterium aurantiacum]